MVDSNGYVMSADKQVVRIENGLVVNIDKQFAPLHFVNGKRFYLLARVGRLTRTEQTLDF